MKNCAQLKKVGQDDQEPTNQDNIDMISQPDCWPHSVLPLKRKIDGRTECGVILSSHVFAGYYSVKKAFLLMLPKEYDDYMLLDGYKYNAIEEIILDGWIID